MTILLSLFGLMFVGSFVLDYQRGKTFRQSLFGGVDTIKRNLLIFLRTSLSMMIFIGPLLLMSMFAFSKLVTFETVAAFMIAVLSIGFAERIIGMIVAPLVRTFWHQRGKLMPLYLDAGLYVFLLSILILEFLMNIPGVELNAPAVAVFYAFALFYIRYLFSLIRFTLSKGVPSN
ncbi:putative membrane protein [Exiguobacterium sp. S17]|nr:putative membrane protein [Exiguobacterium sp. S17]